MGQTTRKEVHEILRQNLRRRSDLGFSKAITAIIFEPQNPFEPSLRRKPQRWFMFVLASSLAAISVFVYFNFCN